MDSLPQSIWWLNIVYLGAVLSACALFSFMETSITALRLFNLQELAKRNSRYSNLFSVLEREPHRVLIAILIASCLANVMAADLITDVTQVWFSHLNIPTGWSFFLGISTATGAILIFGEIIPKNLAQAKSERLFQSTLWLANMTFLIMAPLVGLLSKISQFVVNRIETDPSDTSQPIVSEREIQFLIDYINKKGQMDTEKSQMLHSIFDLADTSIKEIMVPQTQVIMLNVDASLEKTLELFSHYHYSRLPVYEGETDNIIGMIHQKDLFLLLSKNEQRPLRELVRPLLFVPENMKVNELLRQFKQQRHHIAIVLNEYGNMIGLVTLEDALEEIVGDINDEHESVADHIVELEQGGWLVYAGVALESLEETLAITFETKDAITLGGFLIERLSHLPKKGEFLSYAGYLFQVQKTTPKRVIQVLITKEEAE